MKTIRLLLLTLALCVAPLTFQACNTSPTRLVYNSLATTGTSVSTAYQAYLQEVVQGTLPTNDVPAVTAQYRQFKVVFDAACVTASFATNITETPPEVAIAASSVTSAIVKAKAK